MRTARCQRCNLQNFETTRDGLPVWEHIDGGYDGHEVIPTEGSIQGNR